MRKSHRMRKKPTFASLFSLVMLLLLLPLLVVAVQIAWRFITKAQVAPANIVVDASHTLESITPVWQAFAQGGEESKNMLAPIVVESKNLTPKYIRIDHIFDHYDVVSRGGDGQLVFNFAKLDETVASIRRIGAAPFFALSYMPPAISADGQVTSAPSDWNEWAIVVQKTVEHYSGKNGLNLSNIYYEVWNEPDLFGEWRYYGEKNYLTLYSYAVQGVNRAQNTNQFFIGGPATTELYQSWIEALAKHVTKNKLRLDFLSWHRYSLNPKDYASDIATVTSWLFPYPELVALPRFITEWGFDSDMHPGYDTALGAAHAVATVRQTLSGYAGLFAFELVDGPPPDGEIFWGRWGLLTHPTTGKRQKPRYQAFSLLNQLKGQRLLLTGEGTHVTGIAARDDKSIKLILTNYDPAGIHVEKIPVTLQNLTNGSYSLTRTRLGQKPTSQAIETTTGFYATDIIMPQNSVVLLSFTPITSSQ